MYYVDLSYHVMLLCDLFSKIRKYLSWKPCDCWESLTSCMFSTRPSKDRHLIWGEAAGNFELMLLSKSKESTNKFIIERQGALLKLNERN